MSNDIDALPNINARQAYLAMLEFLTLEFEGLDKNKTLHLGGLLAEMEPAPDGLTSDPGALETFAECVSKILSPEYRSRWV